MSKIVKKTEKTNKEDPTKNEGQLFHVKPSEIQVPKIRARASMNEENLKGLEQSISKQGIIEPLIITSENGKWVLVAGERRLQAAKNLNFLTVPVINRSYKPEEVLFAELTENLQREDADPISEALVMKVLEDTHSQTHGKIAGQVGKHRTWVTNRIRLLELTPHTQHYIMNQELDASSALELLSIEDDEAQNKLVDEFVTHTHTRDSVRGVIRAVLAAAAQTKQPQIEIVKNYLAVDQQLQPEQRQEAPATPEQPEQTQQPEEQRPTKEICHGCGQPKPSSGIKYNVATCPECTEIVNNVLTGRRKELEAKEKASSG